jgi:hypothetical protein
MNNSREKNVKGPEAVEVEPVVVAPPKPAAPAVKRVKLTNRGRQKLCLSVTRSNGVGTRHIELLAGVSATITLPPDGKLGPDFEVKKRKKLMIVERL